MPRALRPPIEGATYHVTSRGVRRDDIYRDSSDLKYFLQLLATVVSRFEWSLHAYCLMTNHYHLLVETPKANISGGMQRLNSMYAQWFNWRYALCGHLFASRFHSKLVQTDAHFVLTCRYIVLNPVRAGISEQPDEYRWSSYRATAGKQPVPAFVNVDRVHAAFGGNKQVAPLLYVSYVAGGVAEATGGRDGHVPGLTPALAV
jgi:putative transposase